MECELPRDHLVIMSIPRASSHPVSHDRSQGDGNTPQLRSARHMLIMGPGGEGLAECESRIPVITQQSLE